jgi:hypothetical protein
MSWHYSQALEAAYSAANCSDGERFAPWRLMPIAADDSCSGKMKDTCHRSPFGMMSVPSTDAPGEALLMWFRAGFPARISAPQGQEKVLTGQGPAFGWKWQESSVKFDPVSASWKTRQCSLLGGLDEFSETWPRWGTMRNGECWELPMWERATKGTGSGSWPTPCAADAEKGGRGDLYARIHNVGRQRRVPTPQANDWKSGADYSDGRRGHSPQLRHLQPGQLNPDWIEWLMGWPIGWTASGQLETARCQLLPPKHGTG